MVLLSVLSNILASLEPFTKVCIIHTCYFNSLFVFETLFTFFLGYAKKRQIIRLALVEFKKCHTIFLYSTTPQCLTFSLSKVAEFKNLLNFLNFIL